MNAPARKKKTETPLALVGVVEEPRPIAAPVDNSPDSLLALAITRGADMAQIEKLMELKERHDANEARKAFVAAMADFKCEDLAIGKNKHVRFKNKTGGFTEYHHAELFDVTDVVVPALAKHGISHGWQVKQDAGRITVTCTLTHRLGHRESVEMSASADDSGGKNSIQAIASTKTYLERYTLLAATGLATGGDLGGQSDDDDGHGAADGDGPEFPEGDREPFPERTPEEKAAIRKQQCLDAAARNKKQVDQIQEYVGRYEVSGDDEQLRTVAIAWAEIPQPDQIALWLATTKGGVFTTFERQVLSSKLPRLEPDHG